MLGYTLAALGGALLVALGVLIGSLLRSPVVPERPTALPPAILAAPPLPDRPVVIATDSSVKPGAPDVADVGPVRSETAPPRPVAKPRAARLRRFAVTASEGSASPIRYCARVDQTRFRPAAPNGSAEANVRLDAEFMRLKISVPDGGGADGRPAVARVLFENGGDSSVLLDRLEVASASGGLRRATGAAGAMFPIRIPAGGLKEIYRYPLALDAGETGARQFVVVDRDGDSWGATLRPVPCGN